MKSIRFLSFVFTFWGCLLLGVLCQKAQNGRIVSLITSRLSATDKCENLTSYRGNITDTTGYVITYSKCWTIQVPVGGYVLVQIGKIITWHTCAQSYIEVTVSSTGERYKFCSSDVNKNPILASSDVTITHKIAGISYYQSSFDLTYAIRSEVCKQKGSFECDDYLCIPESKICDGEVDCKNGNDELKTKCEIKIRNITGVEGALEKGINWLKSYKTTPWNWGNDVSRLAVVFYLTSYANFNGTNLEEELIAKQVELRTTLFILRDKNNSGELSMFINALLVTCYNPLSFYGTDLVQRLKTAVEDSKTFTNPMAYLTLCKANEAWPETAVTNLNKVLSNSGQPFMIDLQAMAIMALSCQINENSDFSKSFDDKLYKSTIQNFKKMQKQDGSFGNVYTTALITQALLASGEGQNRNWKLKETVQFLIKQLNSSSIDFLSTYMILPILNDKTLVNITQTHCSDNLRKPVDDPVSDVSDYTGTVKRIYYSIYTGEAKDTTLTISLRVPEKYTVSEIMTLAASRDSNFKFESDIVMEKRYIYKIGNIANDPESGKFWLLYVGTYDIKDDSLKLQETDPDKTEVKDGEHLVMWYKAADILFPEEEVKPSD